MKSACTLAGAWPGSISPHWASLRLRPGVAVANMGVIRRTIAECCLSHSARTAFGGTSERGGGPFGLFSLRLGDLSRVKRVSEHYSPFSSRKKGFMTRPMLATSSTSALF